VGSPGMEFALISTWNFVPVSISYSIYSRLLFAVFDLSSYVIFLEPLINGF